MNIRAITGEAMRTERPMSRRRRARFAGENCYVFKSAERADRKLAEDVEAIEDRHRGQRELKRLIGFQFAGARGRGAAIR